MKFLDLFSGIGGFRLAFEQAGHECVGHCEIDKFANKSYIAIHEPKESEFYATDIRAIRAGDLPGADIWTAGFPCQDISIAGNQLGFRGKRSSLFFTVASLVDDLEEKDKPTYLVFENVKNLLSVNRGFDFAKLLIEMDKIGYDAEWDVLNTKEVLPQNRERIFIIGHLRGRSTRKIFPIRNSGGEVDVVQGQHINTITARTGSNDSVGAYVIESEQSAQVKRVGKINSSQDGVVVDASGISPVLTAGHNNSPKIITQDRVYSVDGIAPTLNANGGGNREPKIMIRGGLQEHQSWQSDVSPCLTEAMGKGGGQAPIIIDDTQGFDGVREYDGYIPSLRANRSGLKVIESTRIRKLTPKECFRLQGFPDALFHKAEAVNSNTQLYKQAGNGVTVPVVYEIARRIK